MSYLILRSRIVVSFVTIFLLITSVCLSYATDNKNDKNLACLFRGSIYNRGDQVCMYDGGGGTRMQECLSSGRWYPTFSTGCNVSCTPVGNQTGSGCSSQGRVYSESSKLCRPDGGNNRVYNCQKNGVWYPTFNTNCQKCN